MRRLWTLSAILVTALGVGSAAAQQPRWPGRKPATPATTTQQTTTTTTTTTQRPNWPGSPQPRVNMPAPQAWPTAHDRREHERREWERRERERREHRARWERERREREWREAHRRHDDDRPHGWSKGKKRGWGDCDLPPGQAKKHGCEARDWRRDHRHDRDDHDHDDIVIVRRTPRWPGGPIVVRRNSEHERD